MHVVAHECIIGMKIYRDFILLFMNFKLLLKSTVTNIIVLQLSLNNAIFI